MSDGISQLPGNGVSDEEWVRVSGSSGWENLEASRYGEEWTLGVPLAEFADGPLEAEFRHAMDSALRALPGAVDVAEEDREVWRLVGAVSGEALLAAAATVVDAFSDRIEAWHQDQ